MGMLLAGCAGEKKLDSATVATALEEQQAYAQRLDDLFKTLEANREGLEYPLRPQGSDLGGTLGSASFGDLPEERQLEIKSHFNNYTGKLDGHRQQLTPLLQQIKEVERDLRMLLTALEDPDAAEGSTTEFEQIRQRLDNLAASIEAQAIKVLATQDEIIDYLNSDEFMTPGVPQIIVSSPTM